jgi:hypothetical protein
MQTPPSTKTLITAAALTAVLTFGMSFAAIPTQALMLDVGSDGSVAIYESDSAAVLGRHSGRGNGGDNGNVAGERGSGRGGPSSTEREEGRERGGRPDRELPAQAERRIQMREENGQMRVDIEDQGGQPTTLRGPEAQLQIQERMPAQATDRMPMEADENLERAETEGADADSSERDARGRRPAFSVRSSATDSADGTQEFILEQGRAQARLRGAQFSYDADSGAVTIVTPSGNVQTLNNLPLEAISQMRKLEGIELDIPDDGDDIDDSTESADTPEGTESADPDDSTDGDATDNDGADDIEELEIEVNEDGEIEYVTTASRQERLLGLIPRQVPTEVRLNDATGEIETREVSQGFFSNLLNALSF